MDKGSGQEGRQGEQSRGRTCGDERDKCKMKNYVKDGGKYLRKTKFDKWKIESEGDEKNFSSFFVSYSVDREITTP